MPWAWYSAWAASTGCRDILAASAKVSCRLVAFCPAYWANTVENVRYRLAMTGGSAIALSVCLLRKGRKAPIGASKTALVPVAMKGTIVSSLSETDTYQARL